MGRPLRRTLVALGLVLLLAVAGVLAISWQAGQGLLHPVRKLDARTPYDVGLNWTLATVTTSDGVRLLGWWIPADATPQDNATVVFLHGYGDSKAQGLQLFPFLHNLSVNVLAIDQHADGQSGGAYATGGLLETRDVDAALDWVEARPGFARDPRIALLGWSAGGAAVLRAAPDRPDVDAVITDAAFVRLQDIVDSSIGEFTGLPRWPFGPLAVRFASASVGLHLADDAPVDSVRALRVPLLLVQGGADRIVTPEQVDELAAAATNVPPPGPQVLKVPGAGHVASHKTDPRAYERTVGAFLNATILRPVA